MAPGVTARGRTLEDFEVLQVGVFTVDVELDPGHGHVHCNEHNRISKSDSKMLGRADRFSSRQSRDQKGHLLKIESKIWHSAALFRIARVIASV